jgi:hypothetical protein
MKKLLLLFILLCFFSINSLQARADIYLATGVLTDKDSTDTARDQLEIDLKRSNPKVYESQSFISAYNTTSGFWDFIEGAAQLFDQNGWSMYWDSFITLTHSRLTQHYIDYYSGVSKNHDVDLSLQKKAYKASINAGNQVIVIAHSQGNYFTNEAYDSLSPCEQKSFYMLGTANLADHVSGMDHGRGALATLDNDPITYVPSSMSPNIINSDKFIIEGYSFKLPKYHYFEYYRNNNSVTQSKINTFPEYAMHHFNENNSHTSTPVSGIIDIKLSWGNPSIHMNLSSAIGTKDISYTACSPLEHYYVAREEDVEPGTYGVYVTHSGGVDESYLPQSVSLNIHAPGAVTVFDFNITAADMLNLGNVADIIITEDKKSAVVPVARSTGSTGTVSCYGDCASGPYENYLYKIQPKLKQALLGPLSDANITLTKAEDFINNTPFYKSSTSGGNSLLTSGIFYFTNEVLNNLEPDAYHVMSVIGGNDIDANDDGKLDPTPTLNLGSIRALVNTDIITKENFKVNILSEIAFQLTQELMNEELNTTALQEKLDDIATRLLIEDVDGNEKIDYKDILAWVPIGDKEKLRKPYAEFYEPIVQKIYRNEAIYDDAYALAYTPFFRNKTLRIDENASFGTVVGKVELELSDAGAIYSLVEENDFFEILSDGTIILKDGSTLDYETGSTTTLHVQILSSNAESTTVDILIALNNIPEFAPTLQDLTLTVNKDTDIGTVIGNILQDPGDTSLIAMDIFPSSPFTVDFNGDIRVASSLLEASSDFFALEVEAVNAFGKSTRAHLNITLVATPIVINDASFKTYDDSTALSKVGALAIIKNGNTIENITLSGDGSGDFSIDLNGVIRVATGVTLQSSRKDYYALTVRVNDIYEATVTITVNKRIIGSIDTRNSMQDSTLSLDGTKAYVADGNSGLQIIDISDPAMLHILASIDTPNYAKNVTLSVDGTKAYVADWSSGLQIIDVSNSASPYSLASVNTSGSARSVTLSADGTKAYVADYSSGLQIIDVSNPDSPTIIASVDTPDYAHGVILSADGTKACVADGSSGLQIIDISDSSTPTILASVDTPGYAYGVTLSPDGTKAYVADSASLQIIDVSGMEVPQKAPGIRGFTSIVEASLVEGSIVGEVKVYYSGESGIASFRLEGDRAEDFSIDAQGRITLVNALDSIPNNLYTLKAVAANSVGEKEVNISIRVHSIPEITLFSATVNSMLPEGSYVGKLEMMGDDNTTISYIALSGEGSENFSINSSGEIYLNQGAELHHFVQAAYTLTVTAINSYGSNQSNVLINISAIIATLDTPNNVRGVILSADGTKAYVADYSSGLQIIDISDPRAPTILASIDTPGYARSVTLSADGTKAYVADESSGLQIIDISDPSAPTILASVYTPGYARSVTLSADGTKAYVPGGYSGLQIIDIGDPNTPTILASIDTSGYAVDVALSADGTKAYVADDISGLQIIDISDPSTPTILASVDTSGYAWSVTLSPDGTKAYVADGKSGLQIIDISDSITPKILASVDTPDYAWSVTLSLDGTKAYVADGKSGLQIIDISDPGTATILASVDISGNTWSVTLSADGTKAYVADSSSGLQIIDLTGLH